MVNQCRRKRSDMTPCVIDDGVFCLADDGVCVGCGQAVELNVRQTARDLGVHENTVRNWVRTGRLPARRLPTGVLRFDAVDVAQLRRGASGGDDDQAKGTASDE